MKKRVFIVAEIGCNHNGDPKLAKKMVEEAKKCGVDAVKFQTFKANLLISKIAPKAEYQKVTTGTADSQLEMTRKLELPYDEFRKLEEYAKSLGLEVFSTPFDFDSIDFLIENNIANLQNYKTFFKIKKLEIPENSSEIDLDKFIAKVDANDKKLLEVDEFLKKLGK